MPGWSPEIANEFIRRGLHEGRAFDQMQLQKLVYIAHGWCLAFSEQPLTGDRPEAWEFGPVYRRLADALQAYGTEHVAHAIPAANTRVSPADFARADLDSFEMDVILMVYEDYSAFSAGRLSALTQSAGSPWEQVYANGYGKLRDVPHQLIRDQFVRYAEEAEND